MSQIRLNKTQELEQVLAFLRRKYRLLSEAEIIKVALAEKYAKELEETSGKEQEVKKAYEQAMAEGKKLGSKLLAKKGLKREDLTEQQFYNLLINTRKRHD